MVIGATGWTDEDLVVLSDRCDEADVPAMLVPNFSFGAVLMMRFAAQAARVFPRAEIVELHHDQKRDAPSGTAKLTARRIHDAGAPLPPIHSVRLPGLMAHQETIFGGTGETLTLRHDTVSRESYGPGIVAAVRAVREQRGLVDRLGRDRRPAGGVVKVAVIGATGVVGGTILRVLEERRRSASTRCWRTRRAIARTACSFAARRCRCSRRRASGSSPTGRTSRSSRRATTPAPSWPARSPMPARS